MVNYAITHEIAEQPALSWWVKDTLKHRDCMIATANQQYISQTHEHGVALPKTISEAIWIDHEMGTTLLHDAIQKEMRNNSSSYLLIKLRQ